VNIACFRPDTSKIFVSVGFGFFVEFTLSEALKFIEKKSKFLTTKTTELTADASRIKAHIKLVLEVSFAVCNLFLPRFSLFQTAENYAPLVSFFLCE